MAPRQGATTCHALDRTIPWHEDVMPRPSRMLPVAVLAVALTSVAAVVQWYSPSVAQASGSETYSTRGVVKSFGEGRKYVNIAHEKIPGYMEAMTMSFEPRTPEQLAGLDVGDRVSFTFTSTEDGRRVLNAIETDRSRRPRLGATSDR